MTTQAEPGPENSFVRTRLPWIVAIAAALLYVFKLNHWVSLMDLSYVARATGQTLVGEVYAPLFYLVTIPFGWLPPQMVPIALNLFSVFCGVLILALLARSVALLPHDRTHTQRERETSAYSFLSTGTAWIPPIIAVAVCGLQLSFWTNATNASNELFDTLLFAYVVRCLLEFRVWERQSWLFRAAIVYCAGMTDTWIFVGLFPAFLISIVWMQGLRFFRLGFVAKLAISCIVGWLFYLLLPFIHLFSDGYFWQALKANLGSEKSMIVLFWTQLPHNLHLLLALTSLLPVFIIGIRWKSQFGDPSRLGVILTTSIFHLAHLALLGACIWVAFDPAFSPLHQTGVAILPLYFLGALSVGYFCGYFLLIFKPVQSSRSRRREPVLEFLDKVATTAVYLLLILVPAGLIYKNLPQIELSNGPALKQFATQLTQSLPAKAIVLSDDPVRLSLAQTFFSNAQEGRVFVDTRSIKYALYQNFLRQKHPDWPVPAKLTNDLTDGDVAGLLAMLARSNHIYYLHPSFGYYFEYFYPQPHGLVYELKIYPTNALLFPPPLTDEEFAQNETFWKNADAQTIETLLPAINAPLEGRKPTFRQRLMKRLHIPFEQNPTARALGMFYSRALNTWGAEAQRLGKLDLAGEHFDLAQQLNPDNVTAAANFEVNKKLRAGERMTVGSPDSLLEHFGKYRNLQQVITDNGLFDEPTGCSAQGTIFSQTHLNRQAGQQFERVLTFVPDDLPARLWLGWIYLISPAPQKALPLIADLKAKSDSFADAGINPDDFFRLELVGYYRNNEPQKATQTIKAALTSNPVKTNLLGSIVQTCSSFGDFSNALAAVEKQLELTPDDVGTLINDGYLNLQLGHYAQTIPPLTRALSLQPANNAALFNRAIAYLRTDKLDEAQQDYEALEKANPKAYPVFFGLGEIAYRKKDTNSAVHYYQLYLANAPTNTEEAKSIIDRLKTLTSGK